MKNNLIILIIVLLTSTQVFANKKYENFINPESVAIGPGGNIYVSEIGEFKKDEDGKISKISNDGKVTDIAIGLNDPKGIIFYKNKLYVTDNNVIIEVNLDGSWRVFAATMTFPKTPIFLNDIDVNKDGIFYITDSGNLKSGGAIFMMDQKGKITTLFDDTNPLIKAPNGVLVLGKSKFLMVDFETGELFEGNAKTKKLKKIIQGFPGGDGIVKKKKTIYISSWKEGKIYEYKNGEVKVIADHFIAPADIALDKDGKNLIVPDMKAGTITLLPIK